MMPFDIPLLIITFVWLGIMWSSLFPVLSMPVAKIKREFAISLLITGSVVIIVEWLTKAEMHIVSALALGSFVLFAGVIAYLLRKMDYYVEEILQELFVLTMSSAGIGLVTSIWYWGIDQFVGLLLLRIAVATIPILIFGVSWAIARQKYSVWSAIIYIFLLILKWLTVPFWGVWTIVLLMLYTTLVGYIANWMATTTYAEKVFAWNIAPSKVWSLLALSAGMLVLFF